ncbi:normal mucosa of esophagus-specific gene 1 protein-like [Lineus longissimus]|uniref:normal mucosa of esophagus-specific gene 1 protein-like n=1 Tax=Lineus longissimus TaxID=88925 RepID=UPI002B4C5FF5
MTNRVDSVGNQIAKMKTFGFGLKAFRKYWELVPLGVIIGTACVGVASFSVYAAVCKNDVVINKRNDIPPWERSHPEKPSKLITINQKYEKIPELEKLRKEIGSYRY